MAGKMREGERGRENEMGRNALREKRRGEAERGIGCNVEG
jgi:hypothetical protein